MANSMIMRRKNKRSPHALTNKCGLKTQECVVPMNMDNIIITDDFLQFVPHRYINPVRYRGIVPHTDYFYTFEEFFTSKISRVYCQNSVFVPPLYHFLPYTLNYERNTTLLRIETPGYC